MGTLTKEDNATCEKETKTRNGRGFCGKKAIYITPSGEYRCVHHDGPRKEKKVNGNDEIK